MLSAASAAAGEATHVGEPCPPPTERVPYGGQTLATDGAGFALLIAGGLMHESPPAAITAASLGGATLFLGAPIVHALHGRWQIGVLDFGMRLTLPIVGGLVAASCDTGECGGPVLAGVLIGLSPIWIDAGLLAWEDVPVETARRERTPRPPRMLARLGVRELHPMTKVTRRGMELGLSGTF